MVSLRTEERQLFRMMTDPLNPEDVFESLSAPEGRSAVVVCCPAHEDSTPSLSLKEDDDVRDGVLVHCFAGCSENDIRVAYRRLVGDAVARSKYRERSAAINNAIPIETGENYLYSNGVYKAVVRWVIRREDGTEFTVRERGKMWRRDGRACAGVSEWYVPPGLVVRDAVGLRIVSSESDAKALNDAGWPAVSVPNGDNGVIPDPLWGPEVALWIVGDNDDSGRAWAARAAQILGGTVTMPPEGTKDARDALEKGHTAISEWGGRAEPPAGPWTPVNLASWVADPPPPKERFGPADLLYRGALHWLSGEPGGGKSILTLAFILGELRAERACVLLDEEAGAWDTFGKLSALGATEADLARLVYLPPSGRDIVADAERLQSVVADVGATFVGIDSAAVHLVTSDLDEDSNRDVTAFVQKAIMPLTQGMGVAVGVIDHMTKAVNGGGRYARGAGSKLSIAEVAFNITNPEPFSKANSGRLRLRCGKNRFGDYPEGAEWSVAVLVGDGRVRLEWGPMILPGDADALVAAGPNPKRDSAKGAILAHLASNPGASTRAVREASGVGKDVCEAAVRELMSEGLVVQTWVRGTCAHSLAGATDE